MASNELQDAPDIGTIYPCEEQGLSSYAIAIWFCKDPLQNAESRFNRGGIFCFVECFGEWTQSSPSLHTILGISSELLSLCSTVSSRC